MLNAKYPNIIIQKFIMPLDVRNMCCKYKYYTQGTASEYDAMFQKVLDWHSNPDDAGLIEIAEDICMHSNLESIYEEGTTFEEAVADTATTLAQLVRIQYNTPERWD